jgi:hypothetical protein
MMSFNLKDHLKEISAEDLASLVYYEQAFG